MNIKQLLTIAKEQGWELRRGEKHYQLKPPPGSNAQVQTIAATPSDHRSVDNARAQLRRVGIVFPGDKGWEKRRKIRRDRKESRMKLRQQELIEFGRLVSSYRRENDLTQKELAGKLHVSSSTVSNIETARFPCVESTFTAIANLLGYDDHYDLMVSLHQAVSDQSSKVEETTEPVEVTVQVSDQIETDVKVTEPVEISKTVDTSDQIQPEVDEAKRLRQAISSYGEEADEDKLIDEALQILEHLDEHFAAWKQLVEIIESARDLVVDGQSLDIVLSNRECTQLKGLAAKFSRQ